MDRRVFLRSQRWLTPCERMVTHIPPLFDGAASFHLSMAEQYQQHLGVRALQSWRTAVREMSPPVEILSGTSGPNRQCLCACR
jgi:hypothetical protein